MSGYAGGTGFLPPGGRGPMLRSCGHPLICFYGGNAMRNSDFYKRMLTAGATALLSAVLLSTPALAGEWRANSTGFWYINDDGSYPTYAWKWIDGDGDGVYQCFAFDENGYLMLNQTTPDGYLVGEAGAWFDGVTPVTRTYPVGTYVAPTPIEGLRKYGYASDGTRLVTSRTGSKSTSKNDSSSSSKNDKTSSTNKTTSSSSKNNSSVLNKPNAGNTASVSKKDLVTNKITVGKTDANGDGTTAGTTGTTGSTSTSTTERVDPSTTAPSTSGFGPSVPKKNTSSSSSSGPQTVITNSDGPNRGSSVTTENR